MRFNLKFILFWVMPNIAVGAAIYSLNRPALLSLYSLAVLTVGLWIFQDPRPAADARRLQRERTESGTFPEN